MVIFWSTERHRNFLWKALDQFKASIIWWVLLIWCWRTSTDAVALVREYILSTPEVYNNTSHVVVGGGWDHTIWGAGRWPTSVSWPLIASQAMIAYITPWPYIQADLDADNIIRGRPVILQSKDCHALWVSSKAIEESDPFPTSVEGGVVIRDEGGRPTGLFCIMPVHLKSQIHYHSQGVLLDNAQDLLKQPKTTETDLLRRFQLTVRHALSYGLTSLHDAGLDPVSLAFFKRFIHYFLQSFKSLLNLTISSPFQTSCTWNTACKPHNGVHLQDDGVNNNWDDSFASMAWPILTKLSHTGAILHNLSSL